MEGYSVAGIGRYLGHVLQVSALGLDVGQRQPVWSVLTWRALSVVVVVVVVHEVTPAKGRHLGSEAHSFPGRVHGVWGRAMMVLGPCGVAVSTTQGALKGVAHQGEGEWVAKGWRAEPQRCCQGRMEGRMVRRWRRGRERRGKVGVLASPALTHHQGQRLRLVIGRRHAAQTTERIQWARDDDVAEAVQPLTGGVVGGGGAAVPVQAEGQHAAPKARVRGEGGEGSERWRTGGGRVGGGGGGRRRAGVAAGKVAARLLRGREAFDHGVDHLRHSAVQLLLQRLRQLPSSSALDRPLSVPVLVLPAVHVLHLSVHQGLLPKEGPGPVQEQARVHLGQVVVAVPLPVPVALLQAVGADAVLGQVSVLFSVASSVGLPVLLLLLCLRVVYLVELLLELTKLFLNETRRRRRCQQMSGGLVRPSACAVLALLPACPPAAA